MVPVIPTMVIHALHAATILAVTNDRDLFVPPRTPFFPAVTWVKAIEGIRDLKIPAFHANEGSGKDFTISRNLLRVFVIRTKQLHSSKSKRPFVSYRDLVVDQVIVLDPSI